MRLFAILFLLALVSLGPNKVHAQAMNPSLDVYYTTERSSKLFYPNDTTRTYMHLKLREPVVMLEDRQDGWSKVKTLDGATAPTKKARANRSLSRPSQVS